MNRNALFAAILLLFSGLACAVETDPRLVAAIGTVRADAAQRTGIAEDRIEIVTAESVTWSDGSIGCPRPGVLYTQALIPGWRVKLQVGSEVWDYHAGERGQPVLCPPDRAKAPLPSTRN